MDIISERRGGSTARRKRRRKPLVEIDREHLERIDALKREAQQSPPGDDYAAARLQAAIDQWHAWRRHVVDDHLFASRLTMELDSLPLSNILDAKYPTAQERELIVEIARLRRLIEAQRNELEAHAEAIDSIERKVGA